MIDYREFDSFIDGLIARSTFDKPAWNVESKSGAKPPHWNYIDGCFVTSLLSLYESSGDKKYLRFADGFIDFYVSENGNILGYEPLDYNIDNVSEGRVLFDLYRETGKEKYRKAIDVIYSQIIGQPRIEIGNFWHKKIYPNQVWLDGLYMGQVFYTRYETELNGGKNYDDILSQFQNVRDFMFDENKKLYYHGFDFSKKAFWANEKGLSKSFWLRSIGWFIVALIDVYSYICDAHCKDVLADLFREAVGGVLNYQDADSKMFYQVVDQGNREGNYLETSGSAMIAYALLKGARLNVLTKEHAEIGKEIFEGICDKYLSFDGGNINLRGICLVAGLGPENNRRRDGTFEYYVSEPVVENDAKGVAPLVMAYSELKRIK